MDPGSVVTLPEHVYESCQLAINNALTELRIAFLRFPAPHLLLTITQMETAQDRFKRVPYHAVSPADLSKSELQERRVRACVTARVDLRYPVDAHQVAQAAEVVVAMAQQQGMEKGDVHVGLCSGSAGDGAVGPSLTASWSVESVVV
jgi:hypothetical protein